MNRFKLVVLLIFSGVIGILFVQNKQLLTLQLFCPEPTSEACFFSSPEMPLAAWMSLFAIAGVLSSLCGQLLNQAMPAKTPTNKNEGSKTEDRTYSQTKFQRDKPKKSNFSIPKKAPEKSNSRNSATTDWEEKSSENWEENNSATGVKQSSQEKTTNQETKTQSKTQSKFQSGPQSKSQSKTQSSPTNSDSVYSYKFAESSKNKPQEPAKNKTDDVYDASYRTINNPSSKNTTSQEEDDEEWI